MGCLAGLFIKVKGKKVAALSKQSHQTDQRQAINNKNLFHDATEGLKEWEKAQSPFFVPTSSYQQQTKSKSGSQAMGECEIM